MAFFASAIDTLKILVIALGAGLGAWASSTFWKVMAMTTLVPMLMCGKEAKPRQRQPRLPLYRIRMEQ